MHSMLHPLWSPLSRALLVSRICKVGARVAKRFIYHGIFPNDLRTLFHHSSFAVFSSLERFVVLNIPLVFRIPNLPEQNRHYQAASSIATSLWAHLVRFLSVGCTD